MGGCWETQSIPRTQVQRLPQVETSPPPHTHTHRADTNLLIRTAHTLRDSLQITNSAQGCSILSLDKVKPGLDQFAHVTKQAVLHT